MNRARKVLLLVLVFAASSGAQALTSGKASTTRWLLEAETGSDAGLGFKMPHLAFGTFFERSMGTHIELQGRISFSPDRTYITNDGTTLILKGTGLLWITPRFAVTGGLTKSNLWTSQFNKVSWAPSAGIAIREHVMDMPGRLYVSYVFPTGCQWGANCPIQSSRMLGSQVYWEQRIFPHFRLGYQFGFYRVLNQGNPLQPSAGRTGEVTGDVHVVVRYEFPRGSMDNAY